MVSCGAAPASQAGGTWPCLGVLRTASWASGGGGAVSSSAVFIPPGLSSLAEDSCPGTLVPPRLLPGRTPLQGGFGAEQAPRPCFVTSDSLFFCPSGPVSTGQQRETWSKSTLKAQSPKFLFVPRSLGISKTSPWQDRRWNLSLKPRGPEPVGEDENVLQEKGLLLGGPGPVRRPQPAAPSTPHSRDGPKG